MLGSVALVSYRALRQRDSKHGWRPVICLRAVLAQTKKGSTVTRSSSVLPWIVGTRPAGFNLARRLLLGAAATAGLYMGASPALLAASRPSASFPLRETMLQLNGAPFRVIEQGKGPAVLFCHGFPDTANTWHKQMAALAAAGYRAIALDMRGFGASHAPPEARDYTSHHIVGDLVALLDVLKIDSAVIVGHDWGADHAQRAALMRPDRFRALVSISIPYAPRGDIDTWADLRKKGLGERYYALEMIEPGFESHFMPASRSIPSVLYWLSTSPPANARWDPLDPSRGMLRPAPVATPAWADPSYVAHTVRAFEKTGFKTGLNYYRALPITFELTPALKNAPIRQPSLYIWGAADGLCRFFHPDGPSLADMRRSQPGLVDAIRIDEAGHWVQHEAAERLNRELLKFLRGLDRT